MSDKIPMLNTNVDNLSMDESVSKCIELIKENKPAFVVPVNVDVIIKSENDDKLREITNAATLCLTDGKPLVWISKLMKTPVKEKVSGSDLIPLLCKEAEKQGFSVFIMGGKEGVAAQAAKNLKEKYKDLKIAGTYSPSMYFEKNADEQNYMQYLISLTEPDILLVCLGCPKQEKWVYKNYKTCGAKLTVCAGATVDFLAGTVKRAPKWMSNHGLEWFYRFTQEPKRLFKRYFIDDVKILGLIFKYRDRYTKGGR